MKWFSVYKDSTPNRGQRVLTFSEIYRDNPILAYHLMDGEFVKICSDVTHYTYLQPLKKK